MSQHRDACLFRPVKCPKVKRRGTVSKEQKLDTSYRECSACLVPTLGLCAPSSSMGGTNTASTRGWPHCSLVWSRVKCLTSLQTEHVVMINRMQNFNPWSSLTMRTCSTVTLRGWLIGGSGSSSSECSGQRSRPGSSRAASWSATRLWTEEITQAQESGESRANVERNV